MPRPWPKHIEIDPTNTVGWPEFPPIPTGWYRDPAEGDWIATDSLKWRANVDSENTPCFDRGPFGESVGMHGCIAVKETKGGRLDWVEAHLATAALAAGWKLGPRPGRVPPSSRNACDHGKVPAGLVG